MPTRHSTPRSSKFKILWLCYYFGKTCAYNGPRKAGRDGWRALMASAQGRWWCFDLQHLRERLIDVKSMPECPGMTRQSLYAGDRCVLPTRADMQGQGHGNWILIYRAPCSNSSEPNGDSSEYIYVRINIARSPSSLKNIFVWPADNLKTRWKKGDNEVWLAMIDPIGSNYFYHRAGVTEREIGSFISDGKSVDARSSLKNTARTSNWIRASRRPGVYGILKVL